MNPLLQTAGAYYRVRLIWSIAWRYVAMAAAVVGLLWLTGCATMVKPGMTQESKARDRYECEQEVYKVAQGNVYMLSNGLYRDCMRARGYQ